MDVRELGNRNEREMLTRDSRILVGQGREEIHPLSNHGVLREIFRHLDVKALRSVRETCTLWNEEAYALLQNKSKITITWYNDMDKKRKPTLPTFMKYVESVSPENVFFRNYELYDWCLHSKEEEMTQFWLKCGQHIRDLTLKDSFFGFYEQSYVQNVFYNWTPNMESLQIENVRFLNDPNYKPLSLERKTRRYHHYDEDGSSSGEETDTDTDDEFDVSTLEPIKKCEIRENIQPNYNFHSFSMDPSYEYPNFPLKWKEMFVSYPNLKSLTVHPVFHNDDVDNIKELLTDLIEFQEENPDKLQNLKDLDVFCPLSNMNISKLLPTLYALYFRDDEGDCAVTNKHFEQAMKLKFKLESLRIYFDEVQELSYDIVGKYIAKLSPTLKTLEITSGDQALTIFPPLGKKVSFPKLETISIELNALSSNNVDFLEKTPRLERLTIGDLRSSDGVPPRLFFNTITMVPLNSLRHLHLGEDILTEDCIRKIGEWFPNLSQFEAILDNKLLWAVYKFLHNSLEILDIKGKGVTDVGITGMELMEESQDNTNNTETEPKPSSSKKSESQEPPAKRPKFNETDDRTYIGTSIGQMKKLRHVRLGDSYSPDIDIDRVQLTDDSIYNGFVLLTELTYLGFSSGDKLITEEAFRDLCSRRNIITLDATRFYRGHGIKKTGMLQGQSFTKIEI